jgi:NADH-quinone oxidoreductase subunit M
VAKLTDMNFREKIVLGAFAAATLFFGVYPKPLTSLMDASIAQLAQQIVLHKTL